MLSFVFVRIFCCFFTVDYRACQVDFPAPKFQMICISVKYISGSDALWKSTRHIYFGKVGWKIFFVIRPEKKSDESITPLYSIWVKKNLIVLRWIQTVVSLWMFSLMMGHSNALCIYMIVGMRWIFIYLCEGPFVLRPCVSLLSKSVHYYD